MISKEFLFRGKKTEELKKLDIREFAKLLTSRKKRTLLRQSDEIAKLIGRFEEKKNRGKNIRTHRRDLIIVPKMIGMRIHIHNGKSFVPVNITKEMLGFRLGEFVPTRGRVTHGAPGIGATRSSAAMSVK